MRAPLAVVDDRSHTMTTTITTAALSTIEAFAVDAAAARAEEPGGGC